MKRLYLGMFYIEVLCADGLWRRERRHGWFEDQYLAASVANSYTDYWRIRRNDGGRARDDTVVLRGSLATPD